MRLQSVALALIVTMLAPGIANARGDENTRIAEQSYQRATQFFHTHQYRAAAAAFLTAYDLVKQPPILYNVALSFDRENDFKQAQYYYKAYLTLQGGEAKKRDIAERRITEIEELFERERREEMANASQKAGWSTQRWVAVALAGLAVATLAFGLYFGASAGTAERSHNLQGGFDDKTPPCAIAYPAPPGSPPGGDPCAAAAAVALNDSTIANILFGSAAALAVGGIVLYITDLGPRPVTITPMLGRTGAILTLVF